MLHRGFAMDAASRGEHHRQNVGGHQSQTQAKQRGFGVASRIDFRMKVGLSMLEGRLQGPAIPVELRHLFGRYLTW